MTPAPDPRPGSTGSPTETDATLLVCQTTYDLLDRLGTWPTWGRLDDTLDTRHGVAQPWALLLSIDESLLQGVGSFEPADDHVVSLSIAGLALVPAADEDLRIFLKTLGAVADVLAAPVDWTSTAQRPDLSFGPDWVADHVDLPAAGRDRVLLKQLAVWRSSGLASALSAGPSEDGAWSVTPNRRQIRRFRGVFSIDDYLRLDTTELTTSTGPVSAASVSPATTTAGPAPQMASLTTQEGLAFTFDLAQPLGRGGSGTVFAGWDSLSAPVAVKRVALPRSFDTSKWFGDSRYAEREYDALKAVAPRSEQHVVPLLGHLLEEDWFTLIYPRADFSLEDVVALVRAARSAGPDSTGGSAEGVPSGSASTSLDAVRHTYGAGPTDEQVRAIALHLAKGLAQIHEAGVVHRDLKPANALYLNGRWSWTDLGIARIVDETTSTYTWREHGTQAYQAPEAAGGGSAVHRSDVYSLGCTLHAVILGSPPFEGPNVTQQHRASPPDLDPVGDKTMRLLLTTMLKKQAAGRPSAEQVIAMLEASSGRLTSPLQDLAMTVAQRDEARTAIATRADARRRAQYAARDQFELIWSALQVEASTAGSSVGWGSGQDAWIMRVGDRRLVVELGDSQEKDGTALVLGTLIVQSTDDGEPGLKSQVANIAALLPWRVDQAPIEELVDVVPSWHLFRMAANYVAPTKVPVSEARHDGRGAIGFGQLDDYLLRRSGPGQHTPSVVADEEPLTAEALLALFIDEVRAIDIELGDAG
jgi:serine/threonine protein kinase